MFNRSISKRENVLVRFIHQNGPKNRTKTRNALKTLTNNCNLYNADSIV